MIHVFQYRDKNYIYDVGSGSLHECDKPTADYLKANYEDQEVDITYPNPENTEKYRKVFETYKKIHDALAPIYQER